MKAIRVIGTAVVVAVLAALLVVRVLDRPPREPGIQVVKIQAALEAYAAELRARGAPVPVEVSSAQLIERGLIVPSDLGVLEGMSSQWRLEWAGAPLHAVLARVQTPDGQELVLLGDGSVQQARR